MVWRYSPQEIKIMREGGKILATLLDEIMKENIKEGIQTLELDNIAENYIIKNKGKPAFKGYNGYPFTTCISINEEVVHGFPSQRKLKKEDIVSIDIGVYYKGFYTDAARTFIVDDTTEENRRLVEITYKALEEVKKIIKEGSKLREICAFIQKTVESAGFSVVRKFVGHGIGRELHEEPQIPNYITSNYPEDLVLKSGNVLAIEPMVTMGTHKVKIKENGWTAITKDKMPSAHFEDTIVVGKDGCEVLTR